MSGLLIRPDNGQPAEYVTYLRGYVCLRTTCITPAVRWFSHEQMLVANPMFEPAKPAPAYRPAWEVNPCSIVVWRPAITLWQPLVDNINHVAGVQVRTWGSKPTVWHEALKIA